MTEKTEPEFTAEALLKDGLPDTVEATYFLLLFWESHLEFTDTVAKIIGEDALHERLEYKMQLWVPHAIKSLKTHWGAVDSWVDMILQAGKTFPETVGKLYTLDELSAVRGDAHIREGREAVEYILTGKAQMRQPSFLSLCQALLAGVPKPLLGNPPTEVCAEALKEMMPNAVEEGMPWSKSLRSARENSLALIRELNQTLNCRLLKQSQKVH